MITLRSYVTWSHRHFVTLLLCNFVTLLPCLAQSVTIFGDSYSTFEGYITPASNEPWYFQNSQKPERTDVTSVTQTWWHQLITKQGWRLCMNNSYSGSTGATNDSWTGEPIGEYKYEGITQADLFSFRPAMAHMLEYMTNRYINTRIYFILNNDLREDINSSVLTICQHYGVPCIQLHDIDKKSGHPSVKGMQQIANQIAQFIEENP